MTASQQVAFSRNLLENVAAGLAPETVRLHRSPPVVAFGRQDVIHPGYEHAHQVARENGFEPVERLAGGRAAVFHLRTAGFSWTVPAADPREGVSGRFAEVADVMATALRRLGVDARIGEVAGEYCPGTWSVNARGAVKLVGVGQRLIRGAAHIAGVVVVGDASSIVRVLSPVYAILGLPFDPATVGSVENEVPGTDIEIVEEAIRFELARRVELR